MIIKFNLFPKKEIFKPEEEIKEKYTFLKTYLIIFITIVAAVLVEGVRLEINLKNLKNEKLDKEKKLAEYKKIAQKVESLEKQNEEIKKRISTIISLKKEQGKGLKKIETLIGNIGQNRIVFTQVSIDPSHAEITGVSSDLKDIAGYLKNLEIQKEIINEVSLNKTVKKEGYIEFNAGVLF